jgi:DNA-binding NtrC family response regulator
VIVGAVVLPRAGRTSQLGLDEITAIDGLARHVGGLLAVLTPDARAHARAASGELRARAAESASAALEQERAKLRQELAAAHALGLGSSIEARPVAYDAATRALLRELEQVSAHDKPWLLAAERGLSVECYARVVHEGSARKGAPCVIVRCAATPRDESLASLFGDEAGGRLGALELARSGTLVLLDVCALSPEAQARLAHELLPSGGQPATREPLAASTRLLASVRDHGAVDSSGLLPELRARFAGSSRLPPLRERPQDLASLCLLALDRACRTLGRPPLGLAPDAQARLVRCELTDNLLELERVLERAAARCEGARIDLRELEASLLVAATGDAAQAAEDKRNAAPVIDPDHSLEGLERRALQGALERCRGNKSEAARLLGLKRTTFLDKLRRHGLDRPSGSPIN